jgi:cysteine synthase A
MYTKAKELAEQNGWFLASQFETPANAAIHEATTAREILADFDGQRLDYWSRATAPAARSRACRACCARNARDTKIILTEPANAASSAPATSGATTSGHQPTESHPAFQPHPIQGWTPDFIPGPAGGHRRRLL